MIDGISGTPDIPVDPKYCYMIGYRVRWLGCEGTVIGDGSLWHGWIEVRFDNGCEVMLTKDGYYAPGFSEGRLEVIGKVKPKVKKAKYAYEKHGRFYTTPLMSEDVASSFFNTDFIGSYTKLPWTEIESYDTASEVADAD